MHTTFLMLSSDEAPLLEHSLPAAVAEQPDELLVVDNGSRDATGKLARRHGARCLRLESRLPYSAAMNVGLAEVGGDAVALLQADLFLRPGYLEAAVRRLAEPTVGSVAPKLLRTLGPRPDQRLTEIDTVGMVVDRRRKNGLVAHGRPAAQHGRGGEAFGADGAAALYRTSALRECAIGPEVFDEEIEGWACDADLAWRARVLGWRTVYEPEAVAHHIRTYSPSTRTQMSQAARRMQFRNRYLMMVKNDSWPELRRDLHHVVAYEALALGHALLRERHLLRAYPDAWRLLPGARRRRRHVQGRRRVARVPFGLTPPA